MKDRGFSAVELIVTLFIAAAFLLSGFQLYIATLKDNGQARMQSQANNIAYDYLQRYKSSSYVIKPCAASTPLNNQTITVSGLSNAAVTVAISCPYPTVTSLSKINVSVTYGSPQQTVIISTYNFAS